MFQLAQKLNRIGLFLSYLAIFAFIILGTLAVLPTNRSVVWLGDAVFKVPATIIIISMPITFFCGWLLHRLRIGSSRIYLAIFSAACFLFLTGPYFGFAAWLGMPWVFKWHINGFKKYLVEQQTQQADLPSNYNH